MTEEINDLDFEEGYYLVVSHDDEVLTMSSFKTLEDVKKFVKEQYDEEDVQFDDEVFREYFDDSFVDGDSYSAHTLFKFENGKLRVIHGSVECHSF